jgi:quercetin dioxygenase-like cupin family protein
MEHHAVVPVASVAGALLNEAREQHSRRAAKTLASTTSLRATVIALASGAVLADHDAPPAATLQVITGHVRVRTADREWTLEAGELLPLPPQRHGLDALADSAVLLTVALR